MVTENNETPTEEAKLEVIDLRSISDSEEAFPQMKQTGKKPGASGADRPGRKLKMGAAQSAPKKSGGSNLKSVGAKAGLKTGLKKKDEGASGDPKRGPGRPRREEEKRGPGKPKREEESQKRGPGRPPKKDGDAQKRGPGRPKREEETPKAKGEKLKTEAQKRGPGRPKREEEKGEKEKPGKKVLGGSGSIEPAKEKAASGEKAGLKRKPVSDAGGEERESKRLRGEKVEAKGRSPAGEASGKLGGPSAKEGASAKGIKVSGKGPKKASLSSSAQASAGEKGGVRAAFEAVRTLRNAKVLKPIQSKSGSSEGEQEKPKPDEGGPQSELERAEKGDEETEQGAEVAIPGSGNGAADDERSSEATESDREEVPASEEEVKSPARNDDIGAEEQKGEAAMATGDAPVPEPVTTEAVITPEAKPEGETAGPARDLPVEKAATQEAREEVPAGEALASDASNDAVGAPDREEDTQKGANGREGESLRAGQPEVASSAQGGGTVTEGEPPGIVGNGPADVAEALEPAAEEPAAEKTEAVEAEKAPVGDGFGEKAPAGNAEVAGEVVKEGIPPAAAAGIEAGEQLVSLTPEKAPAEGGTAQPADDPSPAELAADEEESSKLVLRLEPEEEKAGGEENVLETGGGENGILEKVEGEAVSDERGEETVLEGPGGKEAMEKGVKEAILEDKGSEEEAAPKREGEKEAIFENQGEKEVILEDKWGASAALEKGGEEEANESEETGGSLLGEKTEERTMPDDKGEDSGLEKMGEEVEVELGLEVTGPERPGGDRALEKSGGGEKPQPQEWGKGEDDGTKDADAKAREEEKGGASEKMTTRGLGKRERVPVVRFFEEEEVPQRAKAEKPSSKTKGGFKCDICGAVFGNGQALGGHKGSHKPGDIIAAKQPPATPTAPPPPSPPAHPGFPCDICGLVFQNGQKLGGHKSSHKPMPMESPYPVRPQAGANEGGGFTCDICGLVFGNGQALGGHKGSHKATDVYTEAEKLANTRKGTRAPFQKEKKSPKSAPPPKAAPAPKPAPPLKERPQEKEEFVQLGWPCEICGLVFPTGQALGGHKGSHKATYYTNLEKPSPRPSPAVPRSARLLRRLEERAGEDEKDAGSSSDEEGSLRRTRPRKADGLVMGRAKLPMSLRPKDRLQSLAAIVSKKSRRIVTNESLGDDEREKNSKRIAERLKRTAGGAASPHGQRGKGMDSFEEDAVAGLMVLRMAAEEVSGANRERHRRKRSRVKSSPTGGPALNSPARDASTLEAAKALLGEAEASEEEDSRERTVSDDDPDYSSGAEKSGREERRLLSSLEKRGLSSGGEKRRASSRGGKQGQSSGGGESEEDKPRRPETRTKEERRVTRKLRDSSDEEEVWRPRIRERGVDGKRVQKGGEKKPRQKALSEVEEPTIPKAKDAAVPSEALDPIRLKNLFASGWTKPDLQIKPPQVEVPATIPADKAAGVEEGKEGEAHSDGESYSSDEPLTFRMPHPKRGGQGVMGISPVGLNPLEALSPPCLLNIPVMEEDPYPRKEPVALSDEERETLPLSAFKPGKKKAFPGLSLSLGVPFKGPELGGKPEAALGKRFKALSAVTEVPRLEKAHLAPFLGVPAASWIAPGLLAKSDVVRKGPLSLKVGEAKIGAEAGEKKEKRKRKRHEEGDGEGKKKKLKELGTAGGDASRSGSPSDENKSGFGLGMKRAWPAAPLLPMSAGLRPFAPELTVRKVVEALKGVRKGPKKAPKVGPEKPAAGRPESDSGDEDAPIGLLSKIRSPEKKAAEKKGLEKKVAEKKTVKALVPEEPARSPVEEPKKTRKRRRRDGEQRIGKLGDGILALPANGGSNASDPGSLTEANSGSESEDVPIASRVGGYTEITQERPNHVNLEEEIQRAVQESVAMLQQISEAQEHEARRRRLKKEERAARKKRRKEAEDGGAGPEEEVPEMAPVQEEAKPPKSKKSKRAREKVILPRPTTPPTPSQELPLFADALPPGAPPAPIRLASPPKTRPRHVSSSVNEFLEGLGLGDFVDKAWSRDAAPAGEKLAADGSGRAPNGFGRAPEEPGRAPNGFGSGPEEPGRPIDGFGRVLGETGRAIDGFGRGSDEPKRASDGFGRAPDESGKATDGFGRVFEEFGRASAVRPSYTVLTEEEEFENALTAHLTSQLLREDLGAAYLRLKSAVEAGRPPEARERFDLNMGLSLGGSSRGGTPSPAPFLQALREGGLRQSGTPPLGRDSPELGAFFRDKGVVKNGKWLPMHHPGEKEALGSEVGRGSEGGVWGRSESRGQPDLPAVKTGLAQFLGGGLERREAAAGVARPSSRDPTPDRPSLDKTLDLNLSAPLSNRSSPAPANLSLAPLVTPTWTNMSEKELLNRDWDLPTWLPPQLEGRRDSFSKKPYAPPRFSPRDQTGVSGPPLFNGPQPDVWKKGKDDPDLLNPDRPWPNLLGHRQEALNPGVSEAESLTAFVGKGGGVARRESPGFLELRVLSPSVQDQPLFSEKELLESRARGLVLGGLSKEPPQAQGFLRRENNDLLKSAETLRRLLGKNENMTSPAIRSYAEGVNKMLMEGSRLLPDSEVQSKPEHQGSALSARRLLESAPVAFPLQRTASGADSDQRRLGGAVREKKTTPPLPGWLATEVEKRRKAE